MWQWQVMQKKRKKKKERIKTPERINNILKDDDSIIFQDLRKMLVSIFINLDHLLL